MKQVLILLFTITLFANCNSNKGWSSADKAKSMKMCADQIEAKLGDETKKFCSCLIEKAESKYPSYEAADKAATDEEGTKMGQACMKELGLGGNTGDKPKKKGGLFGGDDEDTGGGGNTGEGWSTRDVDAFMTPCQTSLTQQGYTDTKARKMCDCVLQKVEKKYSSIAEADEKGGEKMGATLMKECVQEAATDDN